MHQGEQLEQQQRKLSEARQLLENQPICNCFQDGLKNIKDHLKQKMNLTEESDLKADWDNRIYTFNDADNSPVALNIKADYQKFKADGQPNKSRTKKDIKVFMSFCPFCGRKYTKEPRNNAT